MSNFLNNDQFLEAGFVSVVKNDFFLNYLNASKGNSPSQNESNDPDHSLADDPVSEEASGNQNKCLKESLAHMMNPHSKAKKGSSMRKIKIEDIEDEGSANQQEKKKRKRKKKAKGEEALNNLESEQQSKAQSKNLYINKINHLVGERAAESEDKNDLAEDILKNNDLFKNNIELSVHPYKTASKKNKNALEEQEIDQNTGDKTNEKLAKNRESARNSRMRKKIYVDLLEKKVEQLTQELEAAKKQIESNSSNSNESNVVFKLINNLINGKQQLFDKLERMLNNDADESEVNLLIDSLRLRLGANGSERLNMLNFFFKQIIDHLMPVHLKYMLWSAKEEKDMFFAKKDNMYANDDYESHSQRSHVWAKIAPAVNLSESQKKSIQKYKKKLTQEKSKMEQLIQNLDTTRKEILKQSQTIQTIVDDFRNQVTPVQLGRFLILLDKERNRKEFSAEKLWNFANETTDYDDDSSEQDEFENHTAMQNEGLKHSKHNPYQASGKQENFGYPKRIPGYEQQHARSPDYLESFMDLNLFDEASNFPGRKKVHTECD